MAVGVDADVFDKVAAKLAESGDLEKVRFFCWLRTGETVRRCVRMQGLR